MKIFFDHQAFCLQRYGGVSRYFHELVSGLCKREDVDVSVYLGWYINKFGVKGISDHSLTCVGWKHPFRRHPWIPLKDINRFILFGYLRKLAGDIYHQTYYDKVYCPRKSKRVVTVFDMIHELFPSYNPFYDLTINKKRWTLSRADGIICISESTKRDLLSFYPQLEARIKVIYLGNSIDAPDVVAMPVNGEYILYVGERGRHKNFSLLLDAFSTDQIINSNYKLVCFGGGGFSRDEQLKINHFKISNKVVQIFGGDGLLAGLYRHAAVLVFPSLHEGFGLPPLEAMHYGCPVLVSASGSIPEVVGQAGMYFDPSSKNDLIQKLERILTNNFLRQKNIMLGLEQAKKFNWTKCVSETLDFYRDL